jgi:citrate lyase acyl carrier protein
MVLYTAQAGSSEKCDCLVMVEPAERTEWIYRGENSQLFATRTDTLIREILARYGMPKVRLTVEDFGALTFVICARIEVALERALEGKIPNGIKA